MADFVPYDGPVLDKKPETPKPEFTPYTGEVRKDAPPPPLPTSPGRFALETAANVPKSAMNVARSTVEGFIPSAEKAKNLTALATGTAALESPKKMEKTTLPNGQTVYKPVEAEELPSDKEAREKKAEVPKKLADYFVARYGSMDGFLRALHDDPASVAMDLGTIATLGGGALSKLPGFAGDAANIITRAGKKIDPVNLADKTVTGVAKGAEATGAHALGHLTGGGPEAIRQSVKAGYRKELAFLAAIDGKLPLEDVVKWASGAIANMRKQRNEQYQLLKEATIAGDPKTLPFDKIRDAVKAVDDIGMYEGVPIKGPTAELHAQVKSIIDSWEKYLPKEKFHTAEGLDALKKKLGGVLDNIPPDRRGDRMYVGQIKNAVSQTITKEFPQYAKLMKDYHQASDALEEIEKAMSLGDRATYDAGLRKLLSAMRNNANTNYGNRLNMVDALEKAGAQGLKSALAGSQMSSGMPRGLAGRNPSLTALGALLGGNPGVLGLLPFESPKLVGKGLYGAGRIGSEVKDVLDATVLPEASVRAKLPGRQTIARGGYYGDLANRVIGEEQ